MEQSLPLFVSSQSLLACGECLSSQGRVQKLLDKCEETWKHGYLRVCLPSWSNICLKKGYWWCTPGWWRPRYIHRKSPWHRDCRDTKRKRKRDVQRSCGLLLHFVFCCAGPVLFLESFERSHVVHLSKKLTQNCNLMQEWETRIYHRKTVLEQVFS